MTVKNLILIAFCALAASAAFADDVTPPNITITNPFAPRCALSYWSDSFGRGVEAAFKGGDLRPSLVDEECYQLGGQHGQEILAQSPSISTSGSSCQADFEEGRAKGLQVSILSAGSECYVSGYEAGRADLDVAAREGDASVAGQDCVDAYRAGKRGAPMYDLEDARVTSCYQLGRFEASFPN